MTAARAFYSTEGRPKEKTARHLRIYWQDLTGAAPPQLKLCAPWHCALHQQLRQLVLNSERVHARAFQIKTVGPQVAA